MSTFSERLREAMNDCGMKQVELAEKLNSAQAYISQILNDKKTPSDRMTKDMSEILGVNFEWLSEGIGNKKPDLSREESIAEIVGKILDGKENSFAERALKALASLTYEEMQVLEKVIDSMSSKKDK